MAGKRGLHGGARPPARRRRPPRTGRPGRKRGAVNPLDEALGRGRGGFSTKLHLSCEGRGLPLSLTLTAGQRNESTQLVALLDGLPGEGCRPGHLLADKGYAHDSCRRTLQERGIPHTIPERSDQLERRERRGGDPPGFDAELYRKRNAVERCVNRLKRWRAVATTRYEKRAANYRAVVVIASLMLWLAS